MSLGTLSDIAKKLNKAFQSTVYKQRYPWVDKISEERDPVVIDKLEAKLTSAINAGDIAKIWMAVPEIVAWEEVENFAYRIPSGSNPKKAGPALYSDIDLEGWLAEMKLQGSLTIDNLKIRKVYQLFKDGRHPFGWSVYRCINAEIDLAQKKYILNDGDWYNVESDYVQEVDDLYQSVPFSTISLPNYGALTEPKYLSAVPKTHPQYAVMDRKNVMIGGGRSRVEFCDLYTKSKDIVHVKQYGGSSLLSHLFSQAVVSAGCFLHESAFRSEVNKLLPPGFKLTNSLTEPTASDYTVCIAIMSKVKGPLELPFFSKVTLNHAVREIRRMNFKVTKLKIER